MKMKLTTNRGSVYISKQHSIMIRPNNLVIKYNNKLQLVGRQLKTNFKMI